MKHKLTTLTGLAILATVIAIAPLPLTAGSPQVGSSSVQVTINPEASLSVLSDTAVLTTAGTDFTAAFLATHTLKFKVRTTKENGGTGSITAQIGGTGFGTNGPTLTNLTYTSSSNGVGTGVTSQAVSTGALGTTVLSFPADAHSSNTGDTATLNWTLTNDTGYKTGTYSATVTYTISAQ